MDTDNSQIFEEIAVDLTLWLPQDGQHQSLTMDRPLLNDQPTCKHSHGTQLFPYFINILGNILLDFSTSATKSGMI